jgi:hypothetical protein
MCNVIMKMLLSVHQFRMLILNKYNTLKVYVLQSLENKSAFSMECSYNSTVGYKSNTMVALVDTALFY